MKVTANTNRSNPKQCNLTFSSGEGLHDSSIAAAKFVKEFNDKYNHKDGFIASHEPKPGSDQSIVTLSLFGARDGFFSLKKKNPKIMKVSFTNTNKNKNKNKEIVVVSLNGDPAKKYWELPEGQPVSTVAEKKNNEKNPQKNAKQNLLAQKYHPSPFSKNNATQALRKSVTRSNAEFSRTKGKKASKIFQRNLSRHEGSKNFSSPGSNKFGFRPNTAKNPNISNSRNSSPSVSRKGASQGVKASKLQDPTRFGYSGPRSSDSKNKRNKRNKQQETSNATANNANSPPATARLLNSGLFSKKTEPNSFSQNSPSSNSKLNKNNLSLTDIRDIYAAATPRPESVLKVFGLSCKTAEPDGANFVIGEGLQPGEESPGSDSNYDYDSDAEAGNQERRRLEKLQRNGIVTARGSHPSQRVSASRNGVFASNGLWKKSEVQAEFFKAIENGDIYQVTLQLSKMPQLAKVLFKGKSTLDHALAEPVTVNKKLIATCLLKYGANFTSKGITEVISRLPLSDEPTNTLGQGEALYNQTPGAI